MVTPVGAMVGAVSRAGSTGLFGMTGAGRTSDAGRRGDRPAPRFSGMTSSSSGPLTGRRRFRRQSNDSHGQRHP